MNKFENLNRQFEAAPKPIKKIFYVFLIIIGAILLLMSLLLLIVSPLIGILGIAFAVFIFLAAKSELRSLKNDTSATIQTNISNDNQSFELQKMHCEKILETYDCNVTGVMFINDGVDPQQLIRKLKIGDLIMLVADPHNKYDNNAVKVCNSEGAQIGWLPKGSYEQLEAFNRLSKGESVSAEVSKIYPFNRYPGNYGLVIDIHFWFDENDYDNDFDEDEDED